MITYKDLRTRIRKRIWAGLEPENLKEPHNGFFLNAMMDLAKFIKCLQVNHTSLFQFCATYMDCAKTVVAAPNGRIRRVYTLANGEWCDKVYYQGVKFEELTCWSRNLLTSWTAPDQTGLPPLPHGMRYSVDSSTDSRFGRARVGIHAIHNRRLYIAPWIQSNETLVVEWDGLKSDWKDEDLIDETVWEPNVQLAIQAYVKWKHEVHYGTDPQMAVQAEREYRNLYADLLHECEQRRRPAPGQPCDNERLPTSAEIKDDAAPEESTDLVFANIGDYGRPTSAGEGLVATLVKSWDNGSGRFFIVTNGDNIYAPTDNYGDAVGQFYGDYIADDPDANRFWPSLGNHDYSDPVNGLDDYLAYFKALGDRRYYERVEAPVHFFILNSSLETLGGDTPEPDGIAVTSKQAQWLRAKLATSTARWKVVVVQDPPYTNGTDFPGHTVLRWPFKKWGAHVVISGDSHEYERFEVDGLPYLVNGAGGASLRDESNASTDENDELLQASVYGKYGALRCTATCDQLKFEFIDVDGTTHDTLTLT